MRHHKKLSTQAHLLTHIQKPVYFSKANERNQLGWKAAKYEMAKLAKVLVKETCGSQLNEIQKIGAKCFDLTALLISDIH